MRSVIVGELVELVDSSGPTRCSNEFNYIDLGSIDALSKSISAATRLRVEEAPSRARQHVQSGDVLVSTVRPNLNSVAQVPEELDRSIASTGFSVLRANDARLHHRYLLHWVRSPKFISEMTKLATGASYPAVSDRIVKSSVIPLPPLPEQRRIAAILDQAQEASARRKVMLSRQSEIAASIFDEMFGVSGGKHDFRIVRQLRDVATIGSGSTPDRSNSHYFGGGIPWVKTTELRGRHICSTEESVSEAGARSARLKLYPPGSIVVAMYGQGRTRGQSGVLGIGATVNQACAVIQPGKGVDPAFLAYQIRASYTRLRSLARGGSQANLNLGLVGDLDVLVPALQAQMKFSQVLQRLDAARVLGEEHLAKLDELFASLQHRAFNGEL